MTEQLSDHQRGAISAYQALIVEAPELFKGRQRRPIISDVVVMERFAASTGTVLGVAAQTPYMWLLNDLVRSRRADGTTVDHPYLRVIEPPGRAFGVGVVVLATVRNMAGGEPRIVFVEQERHATGSIELELPRGFGQAGQSASEDALRELREETGYVASEALLLGSTLTDSGTSDGIVSFFLVPDVTPSAAAPEQEEAIVQVRFLTLNEVWDAIRHQTLRDGFTLQALAFFERWLASP